MQRKHLLAIPRLILVLLLGCQSANKQLADNNGSTPGTEHSPSSSLTRPTTPSIPAPALPVPFAYEWTDNVDGWTNLEGEATYLPSGCSYTLIWITSSQQAAAYGCPADSEYMNSDFYKDHSLIFLLFEEPILQVEHAITHFAEDPYGSYRVEIDRFYHDPGSEAQSYEDFLIVVNRNLTDETNITVNITDIEVDYPIG